MTTLFLWAAMLTPVVPCGSPAPKEVITIPAQQMPDATTRARLADLLIESLRDTANHKVNYERERLIRKLAKQLSKKEN